jgi:hypothetical protein
MFIDFSGLWRIRGGAPVPGMQESQAYRGLLSLSARSRDARRMISGGPDATDGHDRRAPAGAPRGLVVRQDEIRDTRRRVGAEA